MSVIDGLQATVDAQGFEGGFDVGGKGDGGAAEGDAEVSVWLCGRWFELFGGGGGCETTDGAGTLSAESSRHF